MSNTIDQTIQNKKAMDSKIKDAIQEFIDNNPGCRIGLDVKVIYTSMESGCGAMSYAPDIEIKVESQIYID